MTEQIKTEKLHEYSPSQRDIDAAVKKLQDEAKAHGYKWYPQDSVFIKELNIGGKRTFEICTEHSISTTGFNNPFDSIEEALKHLRKLAVFEERKSKTFKTVVTSSPNNLSFTVEFNPKS